MMKDNILKNMLRDNENSVKPLDKFEFPMEGYLKIVQKDERTGEIISVQEDHNTVLQWARHATFHCLTGSPYSPQGETRLVSDDAGTINHADHSENPATSAVNKDQTMISGNQYFDGTDLTPWCVKNGPSLSSDYIYAYYPTKILFGTSSEYTSWANLDSNARYQAVSLGYDQADFDDNVSLAINDYSAEYTNGGFVHKRTMNDYLLTKANETVPSDDKFIKGAVKTTITTEDDINEKTVLDDDGYRIEVPKWRGIGRPCFIYFNRDGIPETDENGVMIGRNSGSSNFDDRLTFSFTMPSQDGDDISGMNKFYPYNNYLLKEAGLFCDSRLLTYELNDFTPDPKMPYGIIFCKRYISPFTKTGSSSVSVNWVLYY